MNKLDEILVVDFEATRDDRVDAKIKAEIIEIGITEVSLRERKILSSKSIYVTPLYTKLTPFIVELTGITQDTLDRHGIPFHEACELLRKEYKSKERRWFTHGSWDFWMLLTQCQKYGLPYPMSTNHVNVKDMASMLTYRMKGLGLSKMCQVLNIEFEGRAHSGQVDSYNTAKCLLEIVKRGSFKTQPEKKRFNPQIRPLPGAIEDCSDNETDEEINAILNHEN